MCERRDGRSSRRDGSIIARRFIAGEASPRRTQSQRDDRNPQPSLRDCAVFRTGDRAMNRPATLASSLRDGLARSFPSGPSSRATPPTVRLVRQCGSELLTFDDPRRAEAGTLAVRRPGGGPHDVKPHSTPTPPFVHWRASRQWHPAPARRHGLTGAVAVARETAANRGPS